MFKRSNRGELYTYDPYRSGKADQKSMERCFARFFASEDGRKVLAHLQLITFHRALGPETSDGQLRYLEGQRSLVATILRLIERGRQP